MTKFTKAAAMAAVLMCAAASAGAAGLMDGLKGAAA